MEIYLTEIELRCKVLVVALGCLQVVVLSLCMGALRMLNLAKDEENLTLQELDVFSEGLMLFGKLVRTTVAFKHIECKIAEACRDLEMTLLEVVLSQDLKSEWVVMIGFEALVNQTHNLALLLSGGVCIL